jgi:hypothetical protein
LRARFDRIFKRKTGFVTLDRLPDPKSTAHQRIGERHPCDIGRDCRDAFLGLVKTCAKLEIAFWDSTDSPSRALTPFHACPKSSSPEPNRLNSDGFWPSYLKASQAIEIYQL